MPSITVASLFPGELAHENDLITLMHWWQLEMHRATATITNIYE